MERNIYKIGKDLFITSGEEITGFENNIWVIKANRIFLWQNTMALASNNKPQKIILTDNQDLIRDGVQAINDSFLQYFVQQANNGGVPIDIIEVIQTNEITTLIHGNKPYYKIIIPKEESKQKYESECICDGECRDFVNVKCKKTKQEALGIAAENNWDKINSQFKDGLNPYAHRVGFIEGAKSDAAKDMWYSIFKQEQDKNKYSEEDLLNAFEAGMMFIGEDKGSFREWLEQFKNK